jgi:acyl-coenzyme A synthetase/AMP-(fatty) acid ligase
MPSLPIITHQQPHEIVAWRAGLPITASQFLHDVRTLTRILHPGRHVLNVCTDRYRFAVGVAATLLAGKCSVLPSAQTPEMIHQLRVFAPDVFCLSDDPHNAIDLPLLAYPQAADASETPSVTTIWEVPAIDGSRLATIIFTSGSTGTPIPHRKTWGKVIQCVRAAATRLPALAGGRCVVVGTVPAQHMYGFESTVLLPMQSGGALCSARPFFPADIVATLERLPQPRALFSTPVHLRALLTAEVALPGLQLVVSATAMLSANMAREVEQRFGCPLIEIYGSTETGQIATRRTAVEVPWLLWPEVVLQASAAGTVCSGGHVEQPVPLADVVELLDQQRFLLHGRTADLVNIAGKRNSLGNLNHQLNAIPGVTDGVFFVRDDTDESLAGGGRLAALAVAPGLSAADIIQALRSRIDPVFLPRPLLLVEQLPRNDTGKLPQQTLRAIAAEAAVRQPHLFV